MHREQVIRMQTKEPTIEQLEQWMNEGVCETPEGDIVEPDHPRSYLRIMGMI